MMAGANEHPLESVIELQPLREAIAECIEKLSDKIVLLLMQSTLRLYHCKNLVTALAYPNRMHGDCVTLLTNVSNLSCLTILLFVKD